MTTETDGELYEPARWNVIDYARIFLGFWGMEAIHHTMSGLYKLSRGRIYIAMNADTDPRGPVVWTLVGRVYLWLCSEGYLYGDMRRGEMPPKHKRVSGPGVKWG